MAVSLQYVEPGPLAILILSSFFLLLNAVDWLLSRLIYCGLVGQILIGTAWGTPGAGWLPPAVEDAVTQLGYLGLLLLIFEGGLNSSVSQLRQNLFRSAAVALTGISLPLGLSFLLAPILGATPLQCFTAGAALSSTSLGSTLVVLKASGLLHTRLAAVLASAALLDDVVGLILVQLIQDVGHASDANSIAAAILRPIGVSVGLVVLACLGCILVARPLSDILLRERDCERHHWLRTAPNGRHSAFVLQTLLLTGMTTAASYAGGSNLLAAYLAGAAVNWWYGAYRAEQPLREAHPQQVSLSEGQRALAGEDSSSPGNTTATHEHDSSAPDSARGPQREGVTPGAGPPSASAVYDEYFGGAVTSILKPCFFASIGFALPIRVMFSAEVVWRGLVYAFLMALGKLATGIWLVRFSWRWPFGARLQLVLRRLSKLKSEFSGRGAKGDRQATKRGSVRPTLKQPSATDRDPPASAPVSQETAIEAPPSLYPALLLGTAMVPRGEIGFLIAAIAQSQGLLGKGQGSPLFLVVNWGIFLCTALGPLMTGLLVRRVRRLEERRTASNGAGVSPLGSWGLHET